MDRLAFGDWLDRYVDAWKTYNEEAIGELFSEDASYRYHPWDDADETVSGREQIVANWLANRDRPDSWAAEYRPWVTDGGGAVAVGVSRYLGPDGRSSVSTTMCSFAASTRTAAAPGSPSTSCAARTSFQGSLSPECEHVLAGGARADERHDDPERSLDEGDVRLRGAR